MPIFEIIERTSMEFSSIDVVIVSIKFCLFLLEIHMESERQCFSEFMFIQVMFKLRVKRT